MGRQDELEELAHPGYWNARYSQDNDDAKVYDWLRRFDTIKPFLIKHLPAPEDEPKVLHLGNGNSTLPVDLEKLGYTTQTTIDFSDVVVQNMRAQYPSITWLEMDIRHLTFQDHSFHVCIDKATLDAMLYGSPWDPPDEVKANVGSYVDEVARVLKPAGAWLYITWRQPHFIRPLLLRDAVWTVEVETLQEEGGMFEYFAFVMRKHSGIEDRV